MLACFFFCQRIIPPAASASKVCPVPWTPCLGCVLASFPAGRDPCNWIVSVHRCENSACCETCQACQEWHCGAHYPLSITVLELTQRQVRTDANAVPSCGTWFR